MEFSLSVAPSLTAEVTVAIDVICCRTLSWSHDAK